MSPIEQEVREMLRTKVSEAPVRDEPPPVVLRRTKTLRVVNGITATTAAAALVVGILLGVQMFGNQTVTPDVPSGPVPWKPLPVQVTPEPVAKTSSRPCTTRDISSVAAEFGTGIWFAPDTPEVSCVVDPSADGFELVVKDSSGRAAPVTVRVSSAPGVNVIGQGRNVEGFGFGWSNYCGPRSGGVVFELTLPEGGVFQAPYAERWLPECVSSKDGSVLELTHSFGVVIPRASDSPMVNLLASIEAPEQTRRGETLRYLIRLGNPLDEEILLEPCPHYGQGLATAEGDVPEFESFSLNCAEVPSQSIPAHGSVSFEMRFAIPSDLPGGSWKLTWDLGLSDETLGFAYSEFKILVT